LAWSSWIPPICCKPARARPSRVSIRGADFAEGHELDPATAALVPATAMGRMLDQEEAAKLIRRFERGIPTAAVSVKRAVKRKRTTPR
jgi:hypothetical protein